MRILFTGHRDALCAESALDLLRNEYPGATWLCGGAQGFDAQILQYAAEHTIKVLVFKPDYKKYPAKEAPLRRNDSMLRLADVVIALYDGRPYGGTYYTVRRAERMGLTVIRLTRK